MNYKRLPPEQTIARLRQVGLYGDPSARVYAQATIRFQSVEVTQLSFAQTYVLQPILDRITERLQQLAAIGLDGLALEGALLLDEAQQTFMPPIVEQCPLDSEHWLVADGMHRCYLAYQQRRPIQVLLVSKLPKEYPYYAVPVGRDWRQIQVCDRQPEHRKRYRDPQDYKRLFRVYNDKFPQVQPDRHAYR